MAELSSEGEDQNVAVTQDDSDVDMEELMRKEIQETNEVETTSVTKGRTLLKYVLHLNECSREVDEHVVFRYEGEFFPEKNVSITESGMKISSMQRTLKSWKWCNQPDVKDYLWEDVAGHIGTPKLACRRRFHAVPELQNIYGI
ncbi:hypothetical protein AVEN_260850-1 [Araneus ventricosus]|uniref:Uncharacterized protein n=1 Tax=Araneus ventricosus TaxID=182803 RepID=A0A4Y2P6Q1_ARAVE|nr:hypothetical protein AVEN_260850-1 [Araneus ventricosus]